MIDIHSHILFDVDDGSDTLEESVALLKSASKHGVTDIFVTPHYIDKGEYDEIKIKKAFEELKNEIKKYDINIKVHLGNEVAIYGNIIEIIQDKRINTLGGSRYMLIEFPMSADVNYIMETIYELRYNKIVPIIAHPERCECFRKHIERVKEAVDEGALIQCNTGSILGDYGNTAKKIIKKLLKDNLVHFIATDTHHMKNNRYETLALAEEEVEKLVGLYEKNKLFVYNARKIIIDEEI